MEFFCAIASVRPDIDIALFPIEFCGSMEQQLIECAAYCVGFPASACSLVIPVLGFLESDVEMYMPGVHERLKKVNVGPMPLVPSWLHVAPLYFAGDVHCSVQFANFPLYHLN